MGRPLNDRFFGNRNVGSVSTSSDNQIGGEGVASYTVSNAGSGWTTIPTVSFSTPDIPTGVSVVGTAHYKALSFSTTANGTGYDVGNILEVDTGTQTTKARAPVASITTVGTPTKNVGGSGYADGDLLTFSGAGWTQNLVLRVNRPGGGTGSPDNFTVVSAGIRNAAAPTNPVTYTSRTGSGNGCTVDIVWGVYSFGTPTVVGDYTAFPSTGAAGTLTSVTPATGTGAKADITLGLLSIAISESGSGYTSPADAAITFSGSTGVTTLAVLTTDSGIQNPSQNPAGENANAIIIHANTTGAGTKIGDIQKQVGSRRYKVKTADGVARVNLVASNSPGIGEAYIVATDTGGNTYWVVKLTSRRATLVPRSGGSPQFPLVNDDIATTGDIPVSAGWVFSGAEANKTVTIENA